MEKLNLNPDPRLEPAPGKTAFDFGMAVAQVGAIAFPTVLPGVKLFDLLTSPLRGKRMSDWCEALRLRLNDLSSKVSGLTPEALATSDPFVSAFAQATQAALKTHHEEKIEALRNAILNIAVGRSTNEDEQAIFLGYIDELSPWHLRMLAFLQNPLKFVKEKNGRTDYYAGSLSQPLEDVFPELVGKREFCDQIMRDLRTRGFLNSDETILHTTMTASGIFAPRTTRIADRFLDFIKAPEA
jgi:hypothetical protein